MKLLLKDTPLMVKYRNEDRETEVDTFRRFRTNFYKRTEYPEGYDVDQSLNMYVEYTIEASTNLVDTTIIDSFIIIASIKVSSESKIAEHKQQELFQVLVEAINKGHTFVDLTLYNCRIDDTRIDNNV